MEGDESQARTGNTHCRAVKMMLFGLTSFPGIPFSVNMLLRTVVNIYPVYITAAVVLSNAMRRHSCATV